MRHFSQIFIRLILPKKASVLSWTKMISRSLKVLSLMRWKARWVVRLISCIMRLPIIYSQPQLIIIIQVAILLTFLIWPILSWLHFISVIIIRLTVWLWALVTFQLQKLKPRFMMMRSFNLKSVKSMCHALSNVWAHRLAPLIRTPLMK